MDPDQQEMSWNWDRANPSESNRSQLLPLILQEKDTVQSNYYYSVHTTYRPLNKRNKRKNENAKILLFHADDESSRVMASTE